jgi:hypothetical protein
LIPTQIVAFLDVTPWTSIESYKHFGESIFTQFVPWRGRQKVNSKSWWLFTKLHGFTFHKARILTLTVVKTSSHFFRLLELIKFATQIVC